MGIDIRLGFRQIFAIWNVETLQSQGTYQNRVWMDSWWCPYPNVEVPIKHRYRYVLEINPSSPESKMGLGIDGSNQSFMSWNGSRCRWALVTDPSHPESKLGLGEDGHYLSNPSSPEAKMGMGVVGHWLSIPHVMDPKWVLVYFGH